MYLSGIAVDREITIYVSDPHAHTVRQISGRGVVATIAGRSGVSGSEDGSGANARFNHPMGLAIDEGGNLYIADTVNHAVRILERESRIMTIACHGSTQGIVVGKLPGRLYKPAGIIVFIAPKLFAVTSGGSVPGLKML